MTFKQGCVPSSISVQVQIRYFVPVQVPVPVHRSYFVPVHGTVPVQNYENGTVQECVPVHVPCTVPKFRRYNFFHFFEIKLILTWIECKNFANHPFAIKCKCFGIIYRVFFEE